MMIVMLMIAVMIILSVIIASNKKNKMSFNSNFLFFIHYKTFHPNEYLVNEWNKIVHVLNCDCGN